jgi:hypothetical protein
VPRDDTAERVRIAYYKAKAANPKLTQREFAAKALPSVTKKERKPESGERYLRLILKGERSGREIVAKGSRTDAGGFRDRFQVVVKDKAGNARSLNLVGLGAKSTLDIPLLETELRNRPELLAAKRDEWARRYKIEQEDFDPDSFEIRRVRRHRKHAAQIVLEHTA